MDVAEAAERLRQWGVGRRPYEIGDDCFMRLPKQMIVMPELDNGFKEHDYTMAQLKAVADRVERGLPFLRRDGRVFAPMAMHLRQWALLGHAARAYSLALHAPMCLGAEAGVCVCVGTVPDHLAHDVCTCVTCAWAEDFRQRTALDYEAVCILAGRAVELSEMADSSAQVEDDVMSFLQYHAARKGRFDESVSRGLVYRES